MMNRSAFEDWLYSAPIIALGAAALALMLIAMAAGIALRSAHNRRWPSEQTEQGQEGYVVTAVLGLLALLLGFTLALAVDRFEARRLLVLEEANAIGTTYLRAQVLDQPHRSRISRLLIDYTENRIALARQPRGAAQAELLATNDRLITDLWTATSAAFVTIKELGFSVSFLQTMNNLIDLDAARKTARLAQTPVEVFVVLFFFLMATSGLLAYVLRGRRGRVSAAFVLLLLTISLLLVIDIDRPTSGGVREHQGPMENLRATLRTWPPAVFDRWRIEDAQRTDRVSP